MDSLKKSLNSFLNKKNAKTVIAKYALESFINNNKDNNKAIRKVFLEYSNTRYTTKKLNRIVTGSRILRDNNRRVMGIDIHKIDSSMTHLLQKYFFDIAYAKRKEQTNDIELMKSNESTEDIHHKNEKLATSIYIIGVYTLGTSIVFGCLKLILICQKTSTSGKNHVSRI